mgnify:CR=1 FL=1|tara:strand:+ start:366 stop:530 length:165 start_codon:yes stop_codon:yes gene_type:complete
MQGLYKINPKRFQAFILAINKNYFIIHLLIILTFYFIPNDANNVDVDVDMVDVI